MSRRRPRTPGQRAARLAAVVLASCVLPSTARAGTLVTLGFDDDTAGQWSPAALLDASGIKGTFYVNTGTVGQPGRLTWAQVRDLAARGHEVAGHGVRHVDPLTMTPEEFRANVCDDRQALLGQGLAPLSYAYPNGHYDARDEGIVRNCGYATARALGGVLPSRVCRPPGGCGTSESVPARDPFATRTAPPVNDRTTLLGLEDQVRRAEASGGLLQLVFHHFDDGHPSAMRSASFAAFSRWLAARQAIGTRVVTAAQAATATPAPAAPPVVSVISRDARVRPSAAQPLVRCTAACVAEVTVSPTRAAAARLGLRAGVPAASGLAVLPAAGTTHVQLVVRPRARLAWAAAGGALRLRVREVVTTVAASAAAGLPAQRPAR